MIGENKSEAIIGGGKSGVPCRQQLCIIDSIWAARTGPSDPVSHSPHMIVMGTFGPALDYLTVKKIREPIMGASHNTTAVNKFLTEFGYSSQERDDLMNKAPEDNNGKGWVDALTWEVAARPSSQKRKPYSTQEIKLHIDGRQSVTLRIPQSENIREIGIYNAQGKLIRELSYQRGQALQWDGHAAHGATVPHGTYVLTVRGQNGVFSQKFTLRE
jgi:hypothetical protein